MGLRLASDPPYRIYSETGATNGPLFATLLGFYWTSLGKILIVCRNKPVGAFLYHRRPLCNHAPSEPRNVFVPLERRLWEKAAKPPPGTPILGGDMAPP